MYKISIKYVWIFLILIITWLIILTYQNFKIKVETKNNKIILTDLLRDKIIDRVILKVSSIKNLKSDLVYSYALSFYKESIILAKKKDIDAITLERLGDIVLESYAEGLGD